MTYLATTGTAGVIEINGTVIVEILTFLLMLVILARYVYPEVVKIAEARQRAITEELAAAEKARADAEARLQDANSKLADARRTADAVVEGANRSGEQLRQELREKAEAEYQRVVESAQKDIEADRERALESARAEVAGLVVAATQKVIGETLDERKHHQLIQRAIEEVASGDGRG
jgi:F-type H+-transporting ATPase subunit b